MAPPPTPLTPTSRPPHTHTPTHLLIARCCPYYPPLPRTHTHPSRCILFLLFLVVCGVIALVIVKVINPNKGKIAAAANNLGINATEIANQAQNAIANGVNQAVGAVQQGLNGQAGASPAAAAGGGRRRLRQQMMYAAAVPWVMLDF